MTGTDLEEGAALSRAISTLTNLDYQTAPSDLEPAIESVLTASRRPEERTKVSDPKVFSSILLLVTASPSVLDSQPQLRLQTWRCIGNLLADNDENRDVFIKQDGAISIARDAIVFEPIGGDDATYDRAATVLKVAFNLCHDYAPAQIAGLKARLDQAILKHVQTSLFISKDDTIELALELLGDLTEHLKELPSDTTFDDDFISRLVQLPCNEDVDSDTFIDLAVILSAYFADSRFQEAILATNMLLSAYKLLERTVFLVSKTEQGQAFASLLLRSLTDISALPSFTEAISSDTALLSSLCPRCILTENSSDAITPAVAACILLGNFSTTSKAATTILSQLNTTSLYDLISLKAYGRTRTPPSGTADYLHAAAGMLRCLAQFPTVRTAHFGVEARAAAIALSNFPNDQVQASGLRLLRQLVHDDPHSLHSAAQAGHLHSLSVLFHDTPSKQVKLEIARTAVALLRSSSQTDGQGADQLLDALAFAAGVEDMPFANAAGVEDMPFANAEGWLGFALALRLSPTARGEVCARFSRDESLRGVLRRAVVGVPPKVHGEEEEEEGALPIQGAAQGEAIQDRARENAIVLLSELLKSEELDETTRDELDGIAAEAGIVLRL